MVVQTTLVYTNPLFRDCVLALMREAGRKPVATLARSDFDPRSMAGGESVIIESALDDLGWRRTARQSAERGLSVLAACLHHEEGRVLVCGRVEEAPPQRLLALLEEWGGGADR